MIATASPGFAPAAVPRGPIPSLDGIRAIAVLLVFFAHTGLDDYVPGGLGVTVFFVLSGYLISTLMRTEFAASGAIDYRAFYLRRFLRIMPPLACVVVLTGLLASLAWIDGAFTTSGLLAALFYFGNYHVIANDFAGLPAGLGVVWSLAVEEHFYLLYPPLAALLLRVGRAGTSAGFLLFVCGLVLAWRCWLSLEGASEAYLTMATDTRVDSILIGCVVALKWNPWLDPVPAPDLWRDGSLLAACVAVLLFTLLYRDEFFRETFRHTLQSLACAPLLYLAVARATRWPFRWLNSRSLVYIGTLSYTVYLSHHVMLELAGRQWPGLGWIGTTLVAMALTLCVAEPMRRWVEVPCARLRRRLHGSKRARSSGETVREPASPGAR